MRRGESPLVQLAVPSQRTDAAAVHLARPVREEVDRTAGTGPTADARELLGGLRNDPSLRFNQVGRSLLRWLEVCAVDPQGWEQVLQNVPPHCTELVAAAARECARTWDKVAEDVQRRGDERPSAQRRADEALRRVGQDGAVDPGGGEGVEPAQGHEDVARRGARVARVRERR
jgi:hypothetical protein